MKNYNDLNIKPENLPSTIPVFPLSGVLLLPGIELPLNIFEPRYINMIDDAMAEKKLFGVIQPKNSLFSKITGVNNLYETGCLGKIKAYNETEDGRYLIISSGVTRFKLGEEIPTTRGYKRFRVNYSNFTEDFSVENTRHAFKLSIDRFELLNKINKYLLDNKTDASLSNIKGLDGTTDGFLIDFLCSYLPFSDEEKQLFLEASSIKEREEELYKVLGMAEAENKFKNNSKILH